MNIFIERASSAIPFKWKDFFKYFKYKRELNKFAKKISRGSPSFGVLWNFAEFIKYAEQIYFYDNTKDSFVYSSVDYIPMQNGFKINDKDINIVIKMYSDSKKIGMDIERKKGNRLKTSYTFVNDEWTVDPDEYDQLLLDNVITIINNNMLKLLYQCVYMQLKKYGCSDD